MTQTDDRAPKDMTRRAAARRIDSGENPIEKKPPAGWGRRGLKGLPMNLRDYAVASFRR